MLVEIHKKLAVTVKYIVYMNDNDELKKKTYAKKINTIIFIL